MAERLNKSINKSIAFNHSNIIESVINELMLASCDERLLAMLEESTYEVVEYINQLEVYTVNPILPTIDEQNFKTSPALNRKIFDNESKGFLQTIDDLNKQIMHLKTEREKNSVTYRENVNKILHENNNSKQLIDKFRQDMNDLHVSCNNKEKQINILKIELSVAEDNIKSLKRDINHSKKHNNNNINTGKEKDNSKHLTESIGLKAGIDTLKHQLQIEKNNNKTSTHQLITQLDITKRKLDQCEGDLIQKNIEITSLISLKDDLYQANEKYCNDMIDKENEYMALQQLYQEAQIGSEKYYKLYNETLKENQSQYDYYSNKEKLLNDANRELRSNLNKFRASLINLQNEIIELKDSNNTTECFTELSNKRLQTQIEVLIKQNETLWQSSIDQDDIINNTTKIINNLTQRINSPAKSPVSSPLRIPIINNLNDASLNNNIYVILKQKDDEIASLKEQYAIESKDIANHVSSMEERLSKLNEENQILRESTNMKNGIQSEVEGQYLPKNDNIDNKTEEIELWKSQVVSLKAQLEEILGDHNPSELQNRINYLEVRSKVLEDQIHSMPSSLQVAQAEKKVIEMKMSKIIENMATENAILKQQCIQQNKELHTLLSIEVAEKESLRDRVKEQAVTVHQLTNSLKLLQDQLHHINDNPLRKNMTTQSLYKELNILATPWETSNNNFITTSTNYTFQSPVRSHDNEVNNIVEHSPIKWTKNDNKDSNNISVSKTFLTDQQSIVFDNNTNIKDVIMNNEAKFQDLCTFLQSLDGIYM